MTIGVFDSGIGGKAIANHIGAAFPDATITLVDDAKNLPYGSKSLETVQQLTETAVLPLIQSNVDVIVLACNTATAAAIDYLREKYPDQLFIGLEPMIKPAAESTKSSKVIICATPATLSSQRYHSLKVRYGNGVQFYEPDCSTWAEMIQKNKLYGATITSGLKPALSEGADVIVLACTHYHWIREQIQSLAPKTTIIDPSDAIVRRIKQILAQT